MPAIDAHRLFLSAVTPEFGRYRVLLAEQFTAVSVQPVFQEEFEYANVDLVEKLYQLIVPCDVVIHFVGAGSGANANPAAVADFFRRCEQREPDFLGFWKHQHGIERAFFDDLSYTQWEAVIAFFLGKKFIAMQPKGLVTDGHPLGKPPFSATADDATSQQRHINWLSKTIRRYPEPLNEQNGSYLEDAFHKTVGFLLREGSRPWQQVAQALEPREQKIAPSRLYCHHTALGSTGEFLGRNKELALLDTAWTTPGTNILSIIAWGGVGKTALLAEWVDSRFVKCEWQEAEGKPAPLCYFDWTFYDQGTRADDASHAGAASVDSFFDSALRFFGDAEPSQPGKGERLARLVQAQRTLLVLDGLEPLQYPLNHPQAGQLTDPDLHTLLATLAQRNRGLCLVTSRQVLSGVRGVEKHDLSELSEEDGIRLLRNLQVTGTNEDLAQAVRDYFGHALSLIVLGRFLFVKGGDIRLRDTIKLERANERRNETTTRNAWHVLEAHEQWLGSAAGHAEDLQALRLSGLFDRPASADCLDSLRRAPAIAGLTDKLAPLDTDAWNAVLLRLNESHLIQLRFPPREPNSLAPRPQACQVPLDAHPLIREYFAKQLREQHEAAYRQAHSRLFEHLCAKTEYRPDTLDGLQPLYQAVVHGCLAERHQEACDKVYFDRILRGTGHDGFYSRKKLGAVGANLGAVAAFFETPWSRLHPGLRKEARAWLAGETALNLRALGRLTEAVEPMQAGLKLRITQEDWENVSSVTGNLSQLALTLGRIAEAVANARQSIDFADRSGDCGKQVIARTNAAHALTYRGERDEALCLFKQAEVMQRGHRPQFDILHSLRGFHYCNLILAEAKCAAWTAVSRAGTLLTAIDVQTNTRTASDPRGANPGGQEVDTIQNAIMTLAEAERRATQTLVWSEQSGSLLCIALDHLTLAQVTIYRALLDSTPQSALPNPHLQHALDGLRKAGTTHHLPEALLTAALYHHQILGDPDSARHLLDEVQQISERGPMPLYLADVHLHRARLFRDKTELQKARALIEQYGYGRRNEELADAEEASRHW